MPKLLKEKYKTHGGAAKRCAFENSLAKGEFERGYKAKHYRYMVVKEIGKDDRWRVRRELAQ